ncbi:MAG: asparagine synthase (glutamine-hydrolyzing) [Robiginitomaculum sp.]|nr:MAG: asparagine synthase (glutamine-hydrolyzing) [Robiginitomaculum sp.]
MCGLIAAQLSRPWLQQERLETALETIIHRGPDGRASWFSEDRLSVMGHVRLSIIGLNNGDQPLSHDRGDLHAVVNGEFYGYKGIREKLREQGYRFMTESDSEIALHLYDEYGLGFVDHLRGEYALVLADRRSGEMIAVRDRFGIKPLFYAQVDGEIFFGSEIKALLALGIPSRWDPAGVMSELAFVRGHATMFENIRQVPPGCILIAKDGAVQIKQYWDNVYPTESVLANDTRSEAEVVSGFRSVLDDAVSERLTADVEVACYLSGGLDSSAVLGLAQAKLDRPIRAFTIAFEGEFDESPLAERTAAFTGSNYQPISVSPQDLGDNLSDAIWHSEKPIFNANTVAKFMLSRAVRDAGIKVVFTGEGADEMLAGYLFERRDLMLYGGGYKSERDRQAAITALIESNPLTKSLLFPVGASASGCELVRKAIGFCPSWIENISKQFVSLSSMMRADAPGVSDLDQPFETMLSELDLPGRILGRDAVNISLYTWQKTVLVNFILTVLADRMEMAHSVEGRVPFLDHHVAEYSAGLPVSYKIRETTEKYILRETTKDVITPELYARQKHPFLAPPMRKSQKNRVSDPLLQHCEDIIRSSAFADQPFFEPAKARDYLDSLAKMDSEAIDQASPLIQRMATMSLMQQRFGISN